jgi:hypothetical protein
MGGAAWASATRECLGPCPSSWACRRRSSTLNIEPVRCRGHTSQLLLTPDNTIRFAVAVAPPDYPRLATPVNVYSGYLLCASVSNDDAKLDPVSTRPPAHVASLRRCWREGVSRPLPASSLQVSSTPNKKLEPTCLHSDAHGVLTPTPVNRETVKMLETRYYLRPGGSRWGQPGGSSHASGERNCLS